MKRLDDISDDEIRIIGQQEVKRKPFYRTWWFWATIAAILLAIASVPVAHRYSGRHHQSDIPEENAATESEAVPPILATSGPAAVLMRDTTVNDVPLRLLTPLNAVPELGIGMPDPHDTTLILALQAADIRADNQGIVSAFVLRGELLSRGAAKKGFCAIIDGKIRIGIGESTPLLEEAINRNGYFFRQYPLVNQGTMVENNPKNKALRHALCELDGQIVVASSGDKESFHDFAQALADLGVSNAIYLVGSEAYGFCRPLPDDTTTTPVVWGKLPTGKAFKNVNFIMWRVTE